MAKPPAFNDLSEMGPDQREYWDRKEKRLKASIARTERMKAARLRGTHTKEEWLALCEEFDFRCACCQCEVIGGIPTKDHIVPVMAGGSDHISNIQPLCRNCNSAKTNCFNWVDFRRQERSR